MKILAATLFLLTCVCQLFADSDVASKLDAALRDSVNAEISKSELSRSFESDLARLDSVRVAYEALCAELEKSLAKKVARNAAASEKLKEVGERIQRDSAVAENFGKWLDSVCGSLAADKIAAPVLFAENIKFDKSTPLEVRYSLLISAIKALEKADKKIVFSGASASSGLWTRVNIADSSNPKGDVVHTETDFLKEASK